jgi:hypothetical protein
LKENSMEMEFGTDGAMKWERVHPPMDWPAAKVVIVADRHCSDGTRQHMVRECVQPGRTVANAQTLKSIDCSE